jgi:hypothetical protein
MLVLGGLVLLLDDKCPHCVDVYIAQQRRVATRL